MIKILPMALLTPFVFGTAADTEVIGAEAPVPENLVPELEEGEGLVPPHLSSRRRFELADCADLDQNCADWARQGYCSTNTYVKNYCKASCGSCFINTTGTQTSNKKVDIQEAKREKSLLGERWGTGLNADQGWQPQALAGQPAAGQPAAGQPATDQWNPFRGQRLTDIDRITNTNELLNTQKTTQFGNVEGNPELFNNGLGGNNPNLFNNGPRSFRTTTGTQTSDKQVDIQEAKREKSLVGDKWGTVGNGNQDWQPAALGNGNLQPGQPPAGQPAADQWNTFRGQRLTGTDRITNTNEQINTQTTTQFGNAVGDQSLFHSRFNRRRMIVDLGDEYLGCFDSLRIPNNRIFRNTVPINAEGLYDCRQGCARLGYQMYGFECPRGNGQVHCECVGSLPSSNLEKFDCLSSGARGSCDGFLSYNGVNLGSSHRMTVYGMWRPGQNPTVGDEYKGCYDSMQIRDNRVYKNSVAITAQGLADCRNGCVRLGYDMYGFECPRAANNQVHCECIYGTPRADLLRSDCHVNVGACNARHTFNGINLGTAYRMTVYKVQNAVAGNRG